MNKVILVVAGIILFGLSACASNTKQVQALALADLKCPPDATAVTLEARPYVGTTRYSAEGCSKQRTYVCQKKFWIFGVALGRAECERDQS